MLTTSQSARKSQHDVPWLCAQWDLVRAEGAFRTEIGRGLGEGGAAGAYLPGAWADSSQWRVTAASCLSETENAPSLVIVT